MHSTNSGGPAVGVIGGSGLYEMDGLDQIEMKEIRTPFGEPSDRVILGRIDGRRVCFLPRHGVGHRFLPHEINHRANIWALRSLNVRWLVSVSAVGSLREELEPRHIVVPDQLIDRTGTGAKHTFFGRGIAAHIGFADPYCPDLRGLLLAAAISASRHRRASGALVMPMTSAPILRCMAASARVENAGPFMQR